MRVRLGLTLLFALGVAATAAAAPPRVDNTAKPAEGRKDVTLKELWRAGGEDDEVFFGSIGSVQRGAGGEIYILDTQQSNVQVYSAEGEHQATLGREGEGPGEVSRPGGMFLFSDGRVALLQSFPGRIVILNPDGSPAGEASYQGPGAEQGAFCVLNAGQGAPGNEMVLLGIRMSFGNSSVNDQTFFLSHCDGAGKEKQEYLNKSYQIDYSDFRLDEGKMDFVWSRFAVAADGKLYTAPIRNEYLIRVQTPDGQIEREFTRAYTPPARDAEGKQTATRIMEAIGSYYQVPLKGTSIEPTEPAVAGLFLDGKGNLLVQTGDQAERPAGVFALLDVFDAGGRYVRQLALRCPGDPRKDGLVVLGDDRFIVLRGALDAWLTQQAVAGGQTSEEAPALEVICYAMP